MAKNSGCFKPGNKANPYGRPKKGTSLTDLLEKYLGDKAEGDVVTRKQRLVEKMYNLGLDGSETALKYIFDRIDGTPVQKTENKNVTLPAIIEVDLSETEPDTSDTSAVESGDPIQDS